MLESYFRVSKTRFRYSQEPGSQQRVPALQRAVVAESREAEALFAVAGHVPRQYHQADPAERVSGEAGIAGERNREFEVCR